MQRHPTHPAGSRPQPVDLPVQLAGIVLIIDVVFVIIIGRALQRSGSDGEQARRMCGEGSVERGREGGGGAPDARRPHGTAMHAMSIHHVRSTDHGENWTGSPATPGFGTRCQEAPSAAASPYLHASVGVACRLAPWPCRGCRTLAAPSAVLTPILRVLLLIVLVIIRSVVLRVLLVLRAHM